MRACKSARHARVGVCKRTPRPKVNKKWWRSLKRKWRRQTLQHFSETKINTQKFKNPKNWMEYWWKRTFKNEKCAWKNEKTNRHFMMKNQDKKIATQLFTAFVKSFWCSENSIIIIEKNKKWNKILPQPPAPHHITKNDIRYSDLHRALVNVVIMYLWNFLQKGLVFVFKQCVQD